MDAIITREGNLQINRRGHFVDQLCRFVEFTGPCGHWCPLFLEGVINEQESGGSKPPVVALACGSNSPLHSIIIDHREEEPNAE